MTNSANIAVDKNHGLRFHEFLKSSPSLIVCHHTALTKPLRSVGNTIQDLPRDQAFENQRGTSGNPNSVTRSPGGLSSSGLP